MGPGDQWKRRRGAEPSGGWANGSPADRPPLARGRPIERCPPPPPGAGGGSLPAPAARPTAAGGGGTPAGRGRSRWARGRRGTGAAGVGDGDGRPAGEGAREGGQDAARSPHAAAPAGPAPARVWEEGTHHRFLPHYGASGAQRPGGELTPLVTSLSVALPQPRVPDRTFPAAAVGLLSLPWPGNTGGAHRTFFLRQTSVFQPRKRGEVIFPSSLVSALDQRTPLGTSAFRTGAKAPLQTEVTVIYTVKESFGCVGFATSSKASRQ